MQDSNTQETQLITRKMNDKKYVFKYIRVKLYNARTAKVRGKTDCVQRIVANYSITIMDDKENIFVGLEDKI